MASDIVVQTRFDAPKGRTVGPTPPRPPVIIIRPGRRRHVVAKRTGATVEFIWPTRAGGMLDIVTKGRGVWINESVVGKTVGPTPPRPPVHDGPVSILESDPFRIEIRIGEGGKSTLVNLRPRRFRVNGKTVGPVPPRPPVVPDPTRRATRARPSTGPVSNTPPS